MFMILILSKMRLLLINNYLIKIIRYFFLINNFLLIFNFFNEYFIKQNLQYQ